MADNKVNIIQASTPVLEQLWNLAAKEDDWGHVPTMDSLTIATYLHAWLSLDGFQVPYLYNSGTRGVHADFIVINDAGVEFPVCITADFYSIKVFAIGQGANTKRLLYDYSAINSADHVAIFNEIGNYLWSNGVVQKEANLAEIFENSKNEK